MGTEKSRKVGLSCRRAQRPHPANSRLCACPGRFCFRGAAPKGSCTRPGLAGVCGCHRGTPSPLLPPPLPPPPAAALGEGAAAKAGTPVPPSPGGREGGREGAAARPGGPGGRGDPARLALLLWRRPGQSGTPGERWGGGQKPAGMGTPAGLAAVPGTAAGARGLSGMRAGRLHGSGPGSLRPALGQGVLTVCAQARMGAISGGGWVASPCPCMAAAPLV